MARQQPKEYVHPSYVGKCMHSIPDPRPIDPKKIPIGGMTTPTVLCLKPLTVVMVRDDEYQHLCCGEHTHPSICPYRRQYDGEQKFVETYAYDPSLS